jgi:F-type H+-transporting ATPase subunit b
MLDISWSLMLVEAGIFLITLVLLNMWLFKPLVKFMEDRDAKLAADKQSVSDNEKDTQKYEEEIASILDSAKAEANKIRQEALESAKLEAKKLIETKINEIEKDKADFISSLDTDKAAIREALNGKMPEIKSMLANKMKDIA